MSSGTIQICGGYKNVGFDTLAVNANTETKVASITLPAGVWLVTSLTRYTATFSAKTYAAFYEDNVLGAAFYSQGDVDGSAVLTEVYDISSPTTIDLKLWQGSSAQKNVSPYSYLKAVKIG